MDSEISKMGLGGNAARAQALLERLSAKGIDACRIDRPENVRYLSGFTGEGALYLSAARRAVITDFRYAELAGRQAAGFECVLIKTGFTREQALCALTDADAIRTLGVETDFLTHDTYLELARALPFVKLESASGLTEALRLFKDVNEIACIRRAAEISCRAFEALLKVLRPGMTEREVQIELDYRMLALGSEGRAFETIAAAGANGSLPHAVPSEHKIAPGELLTLDFGATFGGYCADMTRTVGFGHVSPELRAVYATVLEAHMRALDAVRPGISCGAIDSVAREIIDARYPGAFGHSTGHGVGLFIHEQPRVGPGSTAVLEAGQVITIEPGVYIPGLGGCRIEDMAILTSEGHIDPMTAPKQLIEL